MSVLILFASVSAQNKPNTLNTSEPDSDMEKAELLSHITIPFVSMTGDTLTLSDFENRVILIVNVASRCGFTSQYAGLEKLYQEYKDKGFVVIAFPANNFGHQEPGSNKEILEFCQSTYSVTFPIIEKISVKGDDQHPLFTYFTENSAIPGGIQWNFSKILIDRSGTVKNRFTSGVLPLSDELTEAIERLL
jgi:glutathione peroxidase